MDYSTAASFLALALRYRRTHPRAFALALANSAAIVTMSLVTRYPGGLFPLLSFKTHGALDVCLAAFSAAGPALFGFAGEPAARTFLIQAAGESAVIAATDFSR
jgi:hypothetical protein